MIAFPSLLLEPAKQAGMAIPTVDNETFDANEFPHFAVFCAWQCGRSMPTPSAHWDNAKVIAGIPPARIRIVTGFDLQSLGCV